jgi:hypothetical protein
MRYLIFFITVLASSNTTAQLSAVIDTSGYWIMESYHVVDEVNYYGEIWGEGQLLDSTGVPSSKYYYNTVPGDHHFNLSTDSVGRVYVEFMNNNTAFGYESDTSYLLYDFSLIVGDSFEVAKKSTWAGHNMWIQVVNVDSVQFNDGTWHRRLELQPLEPLLFSNHPFQMLIFSCGPFYWIEQIGSNRGPNYLDALCFENTYDILCYYNLNGAQFGECILNINSIGQKNERLFGYPNPTSSTLTIQGLDKIEQQKFLIYDVFGRLMMAGRLDSDQIDVAELSAGHYQIVVFGSTGKLPLSFIKIE